MRIPEAYGNRVWEAVPANGTRTTEVKPSGAATAEPDEAVKVHVSPEARALAEKAHPEGVDETKVARLRAAIQDGSLAIDPRAIAEGIVQKG